jgi:alpha/beta superfamily hydrolase
MTTKKENNKLPFLSDNRHDNDNTSLYIGALAATLLTTGAFFVGKSMLTRYLESKLFKPKDKNHKPLLAPDKYGLEGDVRKLRTNNGDSIEIWHLKGDTSKPKVIFQHGNTGNLSYVSKDPEHLKQNTAFRIEYLKKLQERGIETIAISSRGFGNSTGTPSEANFKSDAKAIADYLEEKNIDPKNTIITGESLGTSTAAILAEEMTERNTPPAGIALIAPFSSMRQQILESSSAPSFVVDMVLNHPLDTNKRLEHIAKTAKERNLIPPHLLVVSPNQDTIIHPSHSDTLIQTAKTNGLYHLQQRQEASHVNWDANEMIDATLDLYKKHNKTTQPPWGERVNRANTLPFFNVPNLLHR